MTSKLYRIFRKIYFILWSKAFFRMGNSHLPAQTARKRRIPFMGRTAFLRPSESDAARVSELISGIYFVHSYLHNNLKSIGPTVLLDIGANIGLSSLSLMEEFPSIKTVIAVEAEKENYNVLKKNFRLWAQLNDGVSLDAIHGICSSSSSHRMMELSSIAEVTNSNTASGTFRFDVIHEVSPDTKATESNAIAISEIIENIDESATIIVKIDIEGGEEYLFAEANDWVRRVAFITIEMHDRYDESLNGSSTNFIKTLANHDFAIVPEKDVLHCYRRPT